MKLAGHELPARRDGVINSSTSTSDVADDDMWELMSSCWSFEPTDRPSCEKICQKLGLEDPVNAKSEDEDQARFVDERRQLQLIVGQNSDATVNTVKVNEILAEVRHLILQRVLS